MKIPCFETKDSKPISSNFLLNKVTNVNIIFLLVFIFCTTSQNTNAADYIVSSDDEFNDLTLVAGDVVTWTNGTYFDQSINFINASGTESNPIILKAQTPGGVVFKGESRLYFAGDYLIVDGFYWDGGEGASDHVSFRRNGSNSDFGNHCTLRNCAFNNLFTEEPDKSRWIVLYGTNNVVENCSFVNKLSAGACILVELAYQGSTIPGHTIKNNYFYNITPKDDFSTNSGDCEAIRIGVSSYQTVSAQVTVENNYFKEADGENEIITNKSADNIFRNNTFRNCRGSLVLRHGSGALVDGNFFLGEGKDKSGGIRVSDRDHVIINNYMQDLSNDGDSWNNGITLVGGGESSGGTGNGYQNVDNIFIAFNTIYSSDDPIYYNDRNSYDPTGVIAYNLVYSDTGTNLITGDISGTGAGMEYVGNIMGGATVGLSSSGITEAVETFTTNGEIVKPISSGIAANEAGNQYAAIVNTDIEGRTRPNSNMDVGAHEISGGTGSVLYTPISDNLVGNTIGSCFMDATGSLSICGNVNTDILTVSSISEFSATGETQTVNVTSNTSWSASDDSSWISITPSNGTNDGVISITTTENPSSTDRSGTVVISGGSLTRTISITQEGASTNPLAPSSILPDLAHFKITYPLDEDGNDYEGVSYDDRDDPDIRALDVRDLVGYVPPTPFSEYFYVDGNEVVFKAHCAGALTSANAYPRSELRETMNGQDDYWSFDEEQELNATFRVTKLPNIKQEVCMLQIKGDSSKEVFRLEYRTDDEDELLHVTINEDDNDDDYQDIMDYSLNDVIKARLYINEGRVYVELDNLNVSGPNGEWSFEYDSAYDNGYFKAGAYTQSSIWEEKNGQGDEEPDSYGEVRFSELTLGTPAEYLIVSDVSDFVYGGESKTMTITSNLDWTVSENIDWISVTPSNGSSNGTVTITTTENQDTTKRTGTLTITGADITKIITITQDGFTIPGLCSAGTNLSLDASVDSFSDEQNATNTVSNIIDGDPDNRWSAEGYPQYAVIDLGSDNSVNEINLIPFSNRAYQFIVEGSSSASTDFFTLVDASDNTTGGETINRTFAAQSVRYVKLTITGASGYTGVWTSINEFEILCSGEIPDDELTVSAVTDFDADGETQTVNVTSNIDWTVAENSDWISVTPSNGSNNGSFTITATENTTTSTRTATVTVTGNDITRIIDIYQEGQSIDDELTVSDITDFDADGETQTVTVTSNIDWTVTENNDWISVAPSNGSNNGSFTITVDENTSTNERSGSVTVAGSDITRLIVINQMGATTMEGCTEGTNLSLNGSIVDFSTEENSINTVENILDGVEGNRWSAEGYPQYAVIDLGDIYDVDEIELYPYQGRAYQFIVEGSSTSSNSDFFTLTDASDNTDGTIINRSFSSQSVRYVKLTITGAYEYTGTWSSIEDFQIICSGTATPPDILDVSSIDNFSADEDNQEVIVTSNTDWTVDTSESWISVTPSSGSQNGSFIITVLENASTNERTGSVIINGGSLTRVINITQEAREIQNNCTSETNLALNAVIVDYSDEQNTINTVDNIIDGDENNRWSALGFPQYAVIDLGDIYHVNKINLMPFDDRAYQFLVEGSSDSSTAGFVTLTDATANTNGGAVINRNFSPQAVRYIRLTITGASGYTGSWSSISDFEIICSGITSSNNSTTQNTPYMLSYPNPTDSFITVEIEGHPEAQEIQIFSTLGQLLHTSRIESRINTIDVSQFHKGMYLIYLTGKNNLPIMKFSKK